MKYPLVLFLCLLSPYLTLGQTDPAGLLSCDSLVGKPYEFLFQEADEVVLARVSGENSYRNFCFTNVLYTYKGEHDVFYFKQKDNPKWFDFKPDSSYIFLIFRRYSDPFFSPCILFGKKENMIDFLKVADSKCHEVPFGISKEKRDQLMTGTCDRSMRQTICGCDGQDYDCSLNAARNGVYSFAWGRCPQKKE